MHACCAPVEKALNLHLIWEHTANVRNLKVKISNFHNNLLTVYTMEQHKWTKPKLWKELEMHRYTVQRQFWIISIIKKGDTGMGNHADRSFIRLPQIKSQKVLSPKYILVLLEPESVFSRLQNQFRKADKVAIINTSNHKKGL